MIGLAWEKGKLKKGVKSRGGLGRGKRRRPPLGLLRSPNPPTELSNKFSSNVIYIIIETFIGRAGVGVW